jgi:hypothetical protein
VIFELTDRWEVGGSLSYRWSETAPRGGDFASNDAGLAALRATWAVARAWDVTGEGRWLTQPDIDQNEAGLLLSVHRAFGDNAKVGVGYNFSRFSDDLRDTTLDEGGMFLNLQVKM